MTFRRFLGGLLLLSAASLACAGVARAQEGAGPKEGSAPPAARKIDEYGRLGGCDHSARLDNFAIELQSDTSARGVVIAYGPAGERSGTADFRLRVTWNYLVNQRGIAPERVKVINGGRLPAPGEASTQLWVVPPGAEDPEPVTHESAAESFRGMFAEAERWDGRFMGEGMTGPPVGDAEMAGFADSLRLQPEAVAYLVAFNGEESAPGAWRRVAEEDVEEIKRAGVEADRIKIIFGGYSERPKAQLWILPKDAPPPAAHEGPERTPKGAVQLGTYPQYQLKYEDEARWVFKSVADVLKADEKINAVFVVRLPPVQSGAEEEQEGEYPAQVKGHGDDEAAEPAEPAAPEEAEEEEPPDVDIARLVEDWKAAFRKEHGIGPERLTIILVPARGEWDGDELDAWLVPQGATIPDPFAVEGEAEAEEPAEGTEQEEPKGVSFLWR